MEKTSVTVEKFQDVRDIKWKKDVHGKVFKTPDLETLVTLKFNKGTLWTDDKLPKAILEYGKTPPLDIEKLHKQRLTGEGVNVAIIDQPLALDHPEYKGKIASYKTFTPENYEMDISSMHGPGVASLLVGENLGTAPKARVYYYAVPTWLKDSLYAAQALEDIIKVNKTLDNKHKIKFVSVSAAFSGNGSPFEKNLDAWEQAVAKAEKEGICVVECSEGKRFVSPGHVDYFSKEFKYGFPNRPMYRVQIGNVHVPNSLRTIAESYDNKNFSYAYNGVGGLSWGIPYATGILCLGQQLNPNLSAEELKEIFIETAMKNDNVVNPEGFIERVKDTLEKTREI